MPCSILSENEPLGITITDVQVWLSLCIELTTEPGMSGAYKPAYLAHFEKQDQQAAEQTERQAKAGGGEAAAGASGAVGPSAPQNAVQPAPHQVTPPHMAIGAAAASPALQPHHKSFLDGDFEIVSHCSILLKSNRFIVERQEITYYLYPNERFSIISHCCKGQ